MINAVFKAKDPTDPVALALEERGRDALREMPSRLRSLPSVQIPLRPFNMVGLTALRALLDDCASDTLTQAASPISIPSLPPLRSFIDDIAAPGRGLVMVMGKGGVGKTTIAASIAAELAFRGYPVHLSTTDPAAHIAATLAGELPNLRISRIDPAAENRQALAADPEEQSSARIVTPLMKLRDPGYTKILLVTLAETTPVSEAERLQDDLRRAEIEPYGWVINSSLAAADSADPCLCGSSMPGGLPLFLG